MDWIGLWVCWLEVLKLLRIEISINQLINQFINININEKV